MGKRKEGKVGGLIARNKTKGNLATVKGTRTQLKTRRKDKGGTGRGLRNDVSRKQRTTRLQQHGRVVVGVGVGVAEGGVGGKGCGEVRGIVSIPPSKEVRRGTYHL